MQFINLLDMNYWQSIALRQQSMDQKSLQKSLTSLLHSMGLRDTKTGCTLEI